MSTPAPRELREYQRIAIDFGLNRKRCNWHIPMGMGKTAATLTLLQNLQLRDPALVLAPLRVARGVWKQEAAEWAHLKGFKVVPIIGDRKERVRALRESAHVHTINYENIEWLLKYLHDDFPFRTVIADESTKLKNFRVKQGGARAGVIGRIAHTHVDRWINLTGGPAPNGLVDLWGQQYFVDGGGALGMTYGAFRDRWFYAENPHSQQIRWVPHRHAEAEIVERMARTTLVLDPKDWFDVAEPIVNPVWCTMEPHGKAQRYYKEMERKFYTELTRGTVSAPTMAVKSQKLLQMAGGAVYHEDHTWEWLHDEKVDAIRGIVAEANGASVLVVYEFVHELERLKITFPQLRVLKGQDTKFEDDWNAGKIHVGALHSKSGGHGLNLQHGGNIAVIMGQTWDWDAYSQVIQRIGPIRQMQSGYDRPVFIHLVLTRDTMDEVVWARRTSKESVQDSLMRRAKYVLTKV